ncbi:MULTISPECIES: sensor histidine kinase [Streptosporangium]|uniref:Signal transduction histidine kinase n=1 Tax=Streptosporangium brasiliense TaxID=47480 RepID=A0ABT9R3Z2_9ACTN|nr:histidine kinase [Streptosporangium brasiliense]MDP9863942.1 signal transduction histidine kinase [Streptosporangium brasiliense]
MTGLARGIVTVVLAGFAAVYVFAGSPLAIVVFGLQLCYVFPSLRRFRGWWLLAVQAAAVYAATLGSGTSVGILGFLGGSLLLTPWWPLVLPVVLSAALIGPADSAISMVLISLVVYGLTRLTERVDEVHAARLALAMAAVAQERLRIAAGLSDGLGRGLAEITRGVRLALEEPDRVAEVLGEVVGTARACLADARNAAAGYRAMSLAPEVATARAMLAAAGVPVEVRIGHAEPLGPAGALLATVLREAVTEIVRRGTARTCLIETVAEEGRAGLRVVSDDAPTAEDENLGDLPAQVAAAGGTLSTGLTPEGRLVVDVMLPDVRRPVAAAEDRSAYGLSVALLGAVLVGFSIKALLAVPADLALPAAACLAVIVVMQLRSVNGRHTVALVLMALLTYLPVAVFGRAWLGVAGFLAGPLLLALPWAVAVPLVACVTASVGVMAVLLGLPLPLTVNYVVSTLVTGLVVYSLQRLAQLVKELQAAREELARSAVVEERLRAARDLHDLLGHSLAAILLKCELARRLGPGPARAELEDVLTMTGRAEADVRAVSGDAHGMSLAVEAESARSVLAAAGIETAVDLAHGALPAEVETVLSAVLREAVTNVLRHSAAGSCAISTEPGGGGVRLRVRNDGAPPSTGRRGSSGIGNLTTRLAALDGTLTAGADDGWFELDAWAPHGPAGAPLPGRTGRPPEPVRSSRPRRRCGRRRYGCGR